MADRPDAKGNENGSAQPGSDVIPKDFIPPCVFAFIAPAVPRPWKPAISYSKHEWGLKNRNAFHLPHFIQGGGGA